MKLSGLQKYILKESLRSNKVKISRSIFEKFYDNIKKAPAKRIRANIITKSIERLIDRGLLVGYGEKTQYKLFITQVKLTPKGKKITYTLFGKQSSLPLKIRKNK